MWFQAIKDCSIVESGVMSLSIALPMVLSSLYSKVRFSSYRQHRQLPMSPYGRGGQYIGSWALSMIGAVLLTRLSSSSQRVQWIVPLVICGLGAGMAVPRKYYDKVFYKHLDPHTLSQTSNWLFRAIGVAMAHAVFLSHLNNSASLSHRTVIETEALLTYNDALTKTFWVSAVASSLALLIFMVLYLILPLLKTSLIHVRAVVARRRQQHQVYELA
jgi:hypothetical protein